MSGILQGLLASISSAAAAVTDTYFNLVTLLLNTNSTNGAQNNTFLDSSTNNFTITRNGNTTQGTFTPFSQTGWGNYLNGSTDYLYVADGTWITLSNNDFTAECWVYNTVSTGGTQTIFGQGNSAGSSTSVSFELYINSGRTISGGIYIGSQKYATSTGTLSLNAWNHIALVRDGGNVRLYINGVQDGVNTTAGTSSVTDQTSQFSLGRPGEYNGQYFNGYISNFRFVNGTCLYPSGTTFTPATTPLTAVTNTKLLTSQSNRFVDNSASPLTITTGGTPSVQAFSPFLPTAAYDTSVVGGSGYFDGTGDYLAVTNNNTFDTNATFTFECWFWATSTASTRQIFSRGGGSTGATWNTTDGTQFALYTTSSATIVWQWNNAGTPVSISGGTVVANAWNHVAIGYNGTTSRLWLNGASIGTSTTAYTLPTTRNLVYVGSFPQVGGTELWNGYLSGLRFVKGTDVYGVGNSTMTIPTAPPTAITNTSLLLNYTNAGIYDSAAKNVLETVGNAQVSTTQAKWGTTSISFNGTNSILQAPASSMYDFGSGDFTIELWTKGSNSASTAGALLIGVLSGGGAANTNWGLFKDGPTQGYVVFYASDGTTYQVNGIGGAATLNDGSWHHVAVTRSGSSFKVFVDGTQVGSTGTYSGSISSTARPLKLGYNGTAEYLNGYLDDVRITKGYARYTANFTPPTAAFPLQ